MFRSGFFILFILLKFVQTELTIESVRGKLHPIALASISYIGKEYEISFDVHPTPHDYIWLGDVYYQSRIHSNQTVWFTGGVHKGRMHICLPNYGHEVFCHSKKRKEVKRIKDRDVGNVKTPAPNAVQNHGDNDLEWLNIRISQTKYGKKFIFTIDVDGKEEFLTTNLLPMEYRNVRILLEERGKRSAGEMLLRNFKVLRSNPLEDCVHVIVNKVGKRVMPANLLAVIPRLKKWFDIIFQFKLTGLCKRKCNVLSFLPGHHYESEALMLPAFYVIPSSYRLANTEKSSLKAKFSICIEESSASGLCRPVPLPKFTLKQWLSVKIMQSKFGKQTFLKVSINGIEALNKIIAQPKEVSYVRVYAAAPHRFIADGVVRNLKIDERCPMSPQTETSLPIDGKWGSWGAHGDCSATCGGGKRTRSRYCDEPIPANNGLKCLKNGGGRGKRDVETTTCNTQKCPISLHGNWASWGTFGPCSRRCGGGEQVRWRLCSDPYPKPGGLNCLLSNKSTRAIFEMQLQACNVHACPIHGGWSKWKWLSECSKTCGKGQRVRSRTCNNPAPIHKGLYCLKSDRKGNSDKERGRYETDIQVCHMKRCPVHGGWGEWSVSTCSKKCGGGIKTGWRFCNRPSKSYGGNECLKSNGKRGTVESTRRACNTQKCPIDGKWSPWKLYTMCTKHCGGGQQHRKRVCRSPSPQYGGRQCPLADSNGNEGSKRAMVESSTRTCNTMQCDSSFWRENQLIVGKRSISRGSKISEDLLQMRKEYKVEFQVSISHTTSLHDNNVLQFLKQGPSTATSKGTDNFLGVWFNGPVMIIRAFVNEKTMMYESEPVKVNTWTKVSILQIEEFGSYLFTIAVNGRREYAMINKKATVVEGVSVWVSNQREQEQFGLVRRLSYFHPDF